MFSDESDFSVHLLDGDGVVFNEGYHSGRKAKDLPDYSEEKNICESNAKLIEFIADDINKAGEGQIESFSIRQSPFGEQENATAYNTSSYCKALSTIHAAVQVSTQNRCRLGKYLTFDTWTRTETGRTFEEATRISTTQFSDDPSFPFDKSKFSILYAKIQKIGAENPDKKNIHIHAWDDSITILKTLMHFFSSKLIPKNVTFNVVYHMKQDGGFYLLSKTQLKGEGEPNPFYEETLRAFYKSKEYKAFEEDPILKYKIVPLFGSYFPSAAERMHVLHQQALDFSQKLIMGQVDQDQEADDYARDMLLSYAPKHPQKTRSASLPVVLHLAAEVQTDKVLPAIDFVPSSPTDDVQHSLTLYVSKKIEKTELVTLLLQKIQEAKTSEEVRTIIETLKSDANRTLLHDKSSEAERSFFNYTWYDQPISRTFNDLVKMAKCKILQLYAQTAIQLSQADRVFLQAGRHWLKVGDSTSFSFFKKLSNSKKKEEIAKKVDKSFEEYHQAIKQRYQLH